MQMFEDLYFEKNRLDFLGISAEKFVEIVESDQPLDKKAYNLNYKNLKSFIQKTGLIPYDQEIISFLRRVDRDDDGVINIKELDKFIKRFQPSKINQVLV
jgi:Ca2+-binding EF-hand superfamily protein